MYLLIHPDVIKEFESFLEVKQWLKANATLQGKHSIYKNGEKLMAFRRTNTRVLWENPEQQPRSKSRLAIYWMK